MTSTKKIAMFGIPMLALLMISVGSIQQVQALTAGDIIPICCTWNENLIKGDSGDKRLQLSYKMSGGTEELRVEGQAAIDAWNTAMAGYVGHDDFLIENTAKGKDGKSDLTIKFSRGGGPIAGQTLRHFDKNTDFVKSVNINISGKFVGNSSVDEVDEILRHEIGHALSMNHTPEPDDLMSAIVNGYKNIDSCHVDAFAAANAWASGDLDAVTPVAIPSQNYQC